VCLLVFLGTLDPTSCYNTDIECRRKALQQFISGPALDLLLTILNMNSANVKMQPHQQGTVTPQTLYVRSAIGI
jgi:hypothetical protein